MAPMHTSILIVAEGNDADAIKAVVTVLPGFDTTTLIPNNSANAAQISYHGEHIVVLTTGRNGREWPNTVSELKHSRTDPGVIVLATQPDPRELLSAFSQGADAFLSLDAIDHLLAPALFAVRNGLIFYRRPDAAIIRTRLNLLERGGDGDGAETRSGLARLTAREKEIFPLLADGKSVKDIARILGLSPKTVETHKYHIMQKLNLDRMSDLTKLAIRKMLIPF